MTSRSPCPGCGRMKPAFAIRDGGCGDCRRDDARTVHIMSGNIGARETADELWARMRRRRDAMLAASDWTTATDAPLSADLAEQWRDWRQRLRDAPAQGGDPLAAIAILDTLDTSKPQAN